MKTPDWRERLKTAVAKSGKKQSVIARDAGVAPETLSRILNASLPNPSFDVIVRIARAVNENVGWLLDERGFVLTMEEQKQLRDVARILDDTLLTSAASRRDRPESNASLSTASEIPRGYAVRGARLAYEAAGDSMTGAGIIDRDVLFVKPTRNTREAAGRVVVCRVEDAEYVRVLDIRAGRTRLISRNERYLPIEVGEGSRFELIGIVVGRTGALS
ncbi:MAG TPA: XRE family transcriptional regulator [Thermoanaerobaculia bacterium]|nr:XRE family transcriptional regulator [Thermoanaerobaculia bacterium]